jgi:uncharacterized SAM-binding protein YcdF (DUF218 family)
VVRPLRWLKLILITLCLVLLGVLARPLWLSWLGEALVHDDGSGKADIAVVLAGDSYGHRMERAAQLVRAGYVPAILVDGPPGFYGVHECDLAIPFIVREGYPQEWFIPYPITALSTQEEAVQVLAELDRRHIRRFLLVTSTYHSARAARIFRAMLRQRSGSPDMRVVAAADEFFQPESWWHNRQSRKIAFTEWSKTIAEVFGL